MFTRNIRNNKYPDNIKQLMYEYPNANTIERAEAIIQELKNYEELNINSMCQITYISDIIH